jgi:succinate dehydrogenase / fumarate reductase, cytochrome b subunit
MNWAQLFTSSIGKKIVMGLTGLFLISFLVIHVGVNACIWANDGGEMFNRAAHFLGSSIVVRILEVVLFIGFIIHIIQGFTLEAENLAKRGKGYKINLANKGSKWYSRTMGLMGTLLFFFLIMHIAHFWVPSRFTGLPEAKYNPNHHDLYSRMLIIFQSEFIVVLYLLGCLSLAWHLAHGFQSAFRTLGLHNKKYMKLVSATGLAFSIIVPLAFAMMPVSIYFGWIK